MGGRERGSERGGVREGERERERVTGKAVLLSLRWFIRYTTFNTFRAFSSLPT